MNISNVSVYGLNQSLIASGYPMATEIEHRDVTQRDLDRGRKLGNAPIGSGHDCMLKGIIVQFDLTAPEFFWRQFDRYHFHDYVSSQSKMHNILKFDIAKMCNENVDVRIIKILKEYIDQYNKSTPEEKEYWFDSILSNCPMGIELTARITSNYLQEKSIYNQRRHHRLRQWQYYCDWQETLPMFKELCLKGGSE